MTDDVASADATDEMPTVADIFERNKKWSKEAPAGYQTQLDPGEETKFRNWLKLNAVPFDAQDATPDYDMRGFYKAYQAGDAKAKSAVNDNDSQTHYPDYWKTPYHVSFSSESKWAKDGAPSWNDKDQLVTPGGKVIFDERAVAAARKRRTAQ